jgi:hypothetical protein
MINGKVARILSDREVVLNVGRKDGVSEGMRFVIYSTGDPIIDPDSGRSLGDIETVKGRVTVTHVMEEACRAVTGTYTTTLPSPFLGSTLGDMLAAKNVTKHYTLHVKTEQIRPVSEDRTVQVGDLVRSLPEP